jgi:hypothetical protein
MYETIKELHIEIEQRIQQITSNRYGSMPPQFYDMMLNRTAIKYIQSKSNRKTNYKGEGLEDSMKRVEDFQSLKRETAWLHVINDDGNKGRGFVLLPSNYLKFISSTSALEYSKGIINKTETNNNETVSAILKPKDDSKFKNVYYKTIPFIDDESYGFNTPTTIKIFNKSGGSWNNTLVDITLLDDNFDVKVEYPKYLVEFVYDKLNSDETLNQKFDVYWEHFRDRYYKGQLIIVSDKIFSITNTTNDNIADVYTDFCFICDPNTYSENDLIASENVRAALNNPYSNKNRHLNPITELINDKLYVYQGQDFCVSEIKITYLKKPRLFSSDLNQMSDMTITPEFVDMVVSDILLILKDNTFNLVKQQTNIE